MRVVIFGASGRVGSSLVPHLIACGHEVFYNFKKEADNTRADLTNADEVISILDKYHPEIIINLAALTDVDECERRPTYAYLINVKIVENLIKWMSGRPNNCHLVQLSTDQLYDGSGPHKEEDHFLSNYYGYSKYIAELIASRVSCTILRTNFIGLSRCNGKASLTDWLFRSLQNGESITVFDDVMFSPLSLKKLVELIEVIMQKRIPGLYNMGSKEGMSKADLAFSLAKILSLPTINMTRGNSDSLNLIRYRPKDMRMDSSLFEKTFKIELPNLADEILSLKHSYEQ